MQKFSDALRAEGKTISFVPTMGFLHEGHASLLSMGRKKADILVLSIFVNPSQFGPNEDLDSYPRNLEGDLGIAEKYGVDAVFTPKPSDIYPEGYETYINVEKIPEHLCGLSRPGHFRGVATVVAKLFNMVKPHFAFFGQKDFQQLAVIRRMATDLNFDIDIIGAPIIREADGLAMSSRNSYLAPDQRKSALCLYQAILRVQEMISAGEKRVSEIIKEAERIIRMQPCAEIDYLAVVDPETFNDVSVIDRPGLFALAVKIGSTRLIDNTLLVPPGS